MNLRLAIMSFAAVCCFADRGAGANDDAWEALASTDVLVTVDGQPITKGDLEFELLWRRAPAEQQSMLRRRFMDELIERRLLSGFLQLRRVDVPEEIIDRHLAQLRQLTRAADRDLDDVIKTLGFTEETLRAHLRLPLAWRTHLNRVVTDRQLEEFFNERREEFDGTRVRASQIVIGVAGDAGEELWQSAEQLLAGVRGHIVNGELEFAEAARQHSTSPSRDEGGDLGYFTFHGRLSATLASAAFKLETGELSQPVRSPFGVHLLLVTDRAAGELSLEDVRGQVFEQMSRELWTAEADRLRNAARIEWIIEPEVLGTAP